MNFRQNSQDGVGRLGGRPWLMVALCLSSLILQPSAFSQVPLQFTYQGRLTDSNGVPVTGMVTGVFWIVKGGDGMSAIVPPAEVVHVETNTIAPDVNGVFSQVLGAHPGNPIALSDLADGATSRWMSVTVTGMELLPRQQLVAVPFAVVAKTSVNDPPVGAIQAYGGTNDPPGYLLCNGRELNRNAYPALFAAIGTANGAPTTNSFRIPDLRGRFLRGVDMGTGRDPDAAGRLPVNVGGNGGDAVGSAQPDNYRSHVHNVDPPNTSATVGGGHEHGQRISANCGSGGPGHRRDWDQDCDGLGSFSQGIFTDGAGNHSHDLDVAAFSSSPSGGNETRPQNVYVHFIIKYGSY